MARIDPNVENFLVAPNHTKLSRKLKSGNGSVYFQRPHLQQEWESLTVNRRVAVDDIVSPDYEEQCILSK